MLKVKSEKRRDSEFREFSEFRDGATDNYLQGTIPNFPKFLNLSKFSTTTFYISRCITIKDPEGVNLRGLVCNAD